MRAIHSHNGFAPDRAGFKTVTRIRTRRLRVQRHGAAVQGDLSLKHNGRAIVMIAPGIGVIPMIPIIGVAQRGVRRLGGNGSESEQDRDETSTSRCLTGAGAQHSKCSFHFFSFVGCVPDLVFSVVLPKGHLQEMDLRMERPGNRMINEWCESF